MKTAPRTVIAGRKGETDTIPDLIRATKSLLRNQLDKQMTRFKKSQPEFFAAIARPASSWTVAAAAAVHLRHPLHPRHHRSNRVRESVSCEWLICSARTSTTTFNPANGMPMGNSGTAGWKPALLWWPLRCGVE